MPEPFQVIPQPRKVESLEGTGLAFGALQGVWQRGAERPVMPDLLDPLPLTDKAGAGTLTLTVAADASLPDST